MDGSGLPIPCSVWLIQNEIASAYRAGPMKRMGDRVKQPAAIVVAAAIFHCRFNTKYDSLHRPIEHWLKVNNAGPQLIERFN